jgi:hypothetical protein
MKAHNQFSPNPAYRDKVDTMDGVISKSVLAGIPD